MTYEKDTGTCSSAEEISTNVQSRLLVATPSRFSEWIERAFLEGADGRSLDEQTNRPSRQIFKVEGERRYLAGFSTRKARSANARIPNGFIWIDEDAQVARRVWNRWVWEQEQTEDWIKAPSQKQMTALEVICRNAHWTRPVGGMLVIGKRGMCLPFSTGPVSLIPEPYDPYAALCGCCRVLVGYVATEIVHDTEWMD